MSKLLRYSKTEKNECQTLINLSETKINNDERRYILKCSLKRNYLKHNYFKYSNTFIMHDVAKTKINAYKTVKKHHTRTTPNLKSVAVRMKNQIKTCRVQLAFHGADTDTDTSSPTSSRVSSREYRRVVELAIGITSGNHASDVSATILARMSMSVSWNSSLTLEAAG